MDAIFWMPAPVSQYEICSGYLKKKLYGPFLWMVLNCLKATESIQGGNRSTHNGQPV